MSETKVAVPEPVPPGGATECPNCGAKGDERCHDTEGPPARFVSRHKSRPRLGDSAYLLWEYQGDGLILYWQNPYNNSAKETVAMMMWPTHAPEKTEEIEHLYERMASTFVTAWNGSAPIAPAAVSGLFDAWWIEHSWYGYASNEELAVAAWNAAVSSQTYVPETQLTAALRSNREKDAKIAELESYRLNADHALNLGILDSQELQDRLRAVSEATIKYCSEGRVDFLLARIRAIVEGK